MSNAVTTTEIPMTYGFKLVHRSWIGGSSGTVQVRVQVIRQGVIIAYAGSATEGAAEAQKYAKAKGIRVPTTKNGK